MIIAATTSVPVYCNSLSWVSFMEDGLREIKEEGPINNLSHDQLVDFMDFYFSLYKNEITTPYMKEQTAFNLVKRLNECLQQKDSKNDGFYLTYAWSDRKYNGDDFMDVNRTYNFFVPDDSYL